LEPLHVNVARLVLIGTTLWAIALVILLAVPDLHSHGRSWWPWTAVAGLLLGLVGSAYLRRGRGNAAAQ
jgi:dolichyl-phosphate-mannose--protein O-mannosyl transferase